MNLQEVMAAEERLSANFLPAQAKLYSPAALCTDPHYSLVITCGEQLRQDLARQAADSAGRDTSLALNAPENYHVTIFTASPKADPQKIKQVSSALLGASPLRLTLQGLHIRPLGIVINAYAAHDELARVRQGLTEKFGPPFVAIPERLQNIGWVTLARFTAPPKPEVVLYVRGHFAQSFGTLTGNNLHLYKTAHRQLVGASRVW